MTTDDREAVRAAYDVVAEAYADHLEAAPGETRQELVALDRFLELVPRDGPVLDAGAGPGRLFERLGGRGHGVVGSDLSTAMLRRARRDHPAVAVAAADLTALPFVAGSFVGVVSWFSTIHLDDHGLAAALAEARRVLRVDGVAAVAFQTGTGERDLAPAYRQLGHEVRLSRVSRDPAHVVRVAATCGLMLVEQHDVPARALGSDGRVALLLRRPA